MDMIIFSIFGILMRLINFVEWVFIGYIILGWFVFFGAVANRKGIFFKVYIYLMEKIEPILEIFRRFLPSLGGLDLSAIVVFVLLHMAKVLLAKIFIAFL